MAIERVTKPPLSQDILENPVMAAIKTKMVSVADVLEACEALTRMVLRAAVEMEMETGKEDPFSGNSHIVGIFSNLTPLIEDAVIENIFGSHASVVLEAKRVTKANFRASSKMSQHDEPRSVQ